MLCYMVTDSAIKKGEKAEAQKYISIYTMVDPQNQDIKRFQKQLDNL